MIGVQLVAIQHKDFEMTKEGIYYAIQNENIKAIYVIPDFHNPTSHIMSLETRKMIAQIAQEKNILIIEDAINNLLEDNPLPPIASFAPEQVICLASLSKTIAPGLRTYPKNIRTQLAGILSVILRRFPLKCTKDSSGKSASPHEKSDGAICARIIMG